MSILPARTSIGVKLALRYGLTLLAALSLFAFGVGSLVEGRINAEARLVLRVHVSDLVDGYEAIAADQGTAAANEWVLQRARDRIGSADRSIGLGFEVLGKDGSRLLSVGSLAGADVPIDRRLVQGQRAEMLRAVNLGREYAFLCLTEAVTGGFLRAAVSTERFARNAADVRAIFLWSIPLLLVVAGGAGWFLSRSALAPIADITAARRVGSDAEGFIPTHGSGDELDRLAETLNEMIGGIRAGVERLRRFSANAAHELRSPLGRILHHLDQLEASGTDPAELAAAAGIRAEVGEMNDRIEALLRLARFEQGLAPEQATETDIGLLVENVGSFFEAEAWSHGIGFEVESEPGLRVLGDASWLVSAVSNLVSNAIKYCSRGDSIVVRARAEGPDVRIDVADTGPGLEASHAETIFERFERASADHGRPGSGLGLAIAREVARAHGGEVELSTKPGRGSTFSLIIPRLAPETGAPSETEADR